jgi:hypothetical protein
MLRGAASHEVIDRNVRLAREDFTAQRLGAPDNLVKSPKDDRVAGILDDDVATTIKAVATSHIGRQADPTVRHDPRFHVLCLALRHFRSIMA